MASHRIRRLIAVASTVIVQALATIGAAQAASPFDRAMDHYETGRYPQALIGLHEAAREGDARAQEVLGFMYLLGPSVYPGVPRDLRAATHWFDRAAGHGRDGSGFVLCALSRQNSLPIRTARPCGIDSAAASARSDH